MLAPGDCGRHGTGPRLGEYGGARNGALGATRPHLLQRSCKLGLGSRYVPPVHGFHGRGKARPLHEDPRKLVMAERGSVVSHGAVKHAKQGNVLPAQHFRTNDQAVLRGRGGTARGARGLRREGASRAQRVARASGGGRGGRERGRERQPTRAALARRGGTGRASPCHSATPLARAIGSPGQRASPAVRAFPQHAPTQWPQRGRRRQRNPLPTSPGLPASGWAAGCGMQGDRFRAASARTSRDPPPGSCVAQSSCTC